MCAKRVLARGDIDGAIPDYGVVLGEDNTVTTLIRSADTTNYLPLRRTWLLRHDVIILTR